MKHLNETLQVRYKRAKTLFNGIFNLDGVALNTTTTAHWMGDTQCFWYRRKTWQGTEFRWVDANAGTNTEAFDHSALANALTEMVGQAIDENNLPMAKVAIERSPLRVSFSAFDRRYTFEAKTQSLKKVMLDTVMPENGLISPNGKQTAFVKDHNLWLQNLESGEQRPLTHSGEPCYAYATSPVALGLAVNANVQALWSPDSKRLLTLQTDKRQVKMIPIQHHIPVDGSLRPQVEQQYCALPGDEHVEEIRLLSIDVATGQEQDANYHRIPVKRFAHGLFSDQLAWWSRDNRLAYFVDQERNGQVAQVVEFDTHSGNTRILFEDTSATFIQLSGNEQTPATLRPLPDTDELIWYSECSGWAHLYLYDLKTGALKNPITEGEWLVRDILHIDTKRRELWIQTAGRVENRDPYYRDICRVNIDTGEITTVAEGDKEYTVLAPRNIDHFWHKLFDPEVKVDTCGVSPDGNYVVTCQSRIDQVPVSQLLDRDGKVLLNLEEADLSGFPKGWQWPEPVKLTASDGTTAIYGAVFKPSDFSPDKHYPVIDVASTSPEMNATPKGLLRNDNFYGYFFLQVAALAELGFIVVLIDGRGSACRAKAFIDHSYGWLPSANNTDDRIAGIQQLAEQRSYMDLDRVGFMSLGSDNGTLFRYPDFYKVGVCFAAFDARLMAATSWGEQFEGEGAALNEDQRAERLVENLQGKLLLIHGFLDPILPVASTLRIVDALQKANKNFDLVLLPGSGHGAEANPYVARRTWDYFVKHLQGIEPPKEFQLALVAE